MIESTSLPDTKPVVQSVTDPDDPESMDINETETPLMLDALNDEDVDTIIGSLEQAARVLKNADELIVSLQTSAKSFVYCKLPDVRNFWETLWPYKTPKLSCIKIRNLWLKT